MPTTHVDPGCEPLLQDIANTLWKARKVVVITGAGISTNSGIPDFRSENGLYSLIQAQFDAAQQDVTGSSNSEADTSDASFDERPVKRRRVSRDELEAIERPFPGLYTAAPKPESSAGSEVGRPADKPSVDHTLPTPGASSQLPSEIPAPSDPTEPRETQTETVEPESVPPRLNYPSPQPPTSPNRLRRAASQDADPTQDPAEHAVPFASSPPRLTLGTPRPRSRVDFLEPPPGSSSPLSSPPPLMLDPYQDSTSSSSQDGASSRSSSEEPSSISTPMLSSQTSFASSRNSLPLMKGKDLFDAQIWSCPTKTSVFYTFVSTLRQKVRSAEPTSSHRFVSVLRDSRKLVRCYTQNIDQLEERVGLSTSLSLGAGNRYRFTLRAGRSSGAPKSAKGAENAPDAGQARSQQADDQGTETGPRDEPQPSQTAADSPSAAGTQDPPQDVPASQPAPGSSSNAENPTASSSSSSAATPTGAPPAPNRGVECVFLHGSLAELRCFVCARTASWDEETRLADTLAGRQPTCPHCAGATAAREERGKRALGVGKLRPDIVLYGEEHPHAHLISPLVQHDLSLGPDMLLILGTSMRVHGLKVLVREFAKAVHDRGGKVVFVNFTKPPESVWADIIDYWVQWDCDAWVGDLQGRKPALWLPPGVALPEEEKPKAVRSARRQSTAESGRQKKDGSEKGSKKAKEGDATDGPKNGHRRLPEQEQEPDAQVQPQEDQQSPLPPPKVVSKRPPKVPREPKLNPDAKRPASIRDHKLNGAYLVWKIMEDLGRITGRSPPSASPAQSQTTSRPRVKKPRKSAPAALEARAMAASERQPDGNGFGAFPVVKPVVKQEFGAPASSPLHNYRPDTPSMFDGDSSITAAVKTRKRKQTVAWRMIDGVETLVSLGRDERPQPQQLPHTTAVFRPSSVPTSRRLPPPTPTTPQSPLFHQAYAQHAASTPSFIMQPYQYPQQQQQQLPHHQHRQLQEQQLLPNHRHPQEQQQQQQGEQPNDIDAGFRETDRLIAQMQNEQSRPPSPHQREHHHGPNPYATPGPGHTPSSVSIHHHHHHHLPPLNPSFLRGTEQLDKQQRQQQATATTTDNNADVKSAHKPPPLEPPFTSPGPPRASISSDVGSPVAARMPRLSVAKNSDAFFWSDPLVWRFSEPPALKWEAPSVVRPEQDLGRAQVLSGVSRQVGGGNGDGGGSGQGQRREESESGIGYGVVGGEQGLHNTSGTAAVGLGVAAVGLGLGAVGDAVGLTPKETRVQEEEHGVNHVNGRLPLAWERGPVSPHLSGGGTVERGGTGTPGSPWCPNEQLRKEEQEAVMSLAAMSGQ